MGSRLSIEREKLKIGQVKKVTSDGGNTIDYIELLLSENAKVLFAPRGNVLDFSITNPKINMSDFDSVIDANVLRDFVIAIKDAYNQVAINERNEKE